MAIKTKRVVQDTPSVVVEQLRRQFNLLLDQLDSSTTYSTVVTNIETNVYKVLTDRNRRSAAPDYPLPKP